MLATRAARGSQAGTTMLEGLITLVILAFGLLGLAGLHLKIQTLDMEAYQRVQAILLLKDMVERIKANSASAADYVKAPNTYYGTDDTPVCPGASLSEKDKCEWSNALQGAAESSSGTKVGAMIDARGCVEEIQAPDPTSGICLPGTYRVTVAWQGLFATSAPSLSCGSGKYGVPVNEAVRRAIANTIVIGLPTCI